MWTCQFASACVCDAPLTLYTKLYSYYEQNSALCARLASQWLIANQPYMEYRYGWWSWGRIISVGSECGLDGSGDGFSGGSNISVRRLNRSFVVCKNQNGRAENHSELIWLPNSKLACFQGLNSCCIKDHAFPGLLPRICADRVFSTMLYWTSPRHVCQTFLFRVFTFHSITQLTKKFQ